MDTYHIQPTDNNVKGRLALVTGASGGIGSVCAVSLAAEGCDVAIHYSASKDKADALAAELKTKHPNQLIVTVQADLTSRESTRDLVPQLLAIPEVAAKHKAISILVANAGIGKRIRDIKDIGEDDFDTMMEVNIRSQFVVVKGCVDGMREQSWGRVILVGSIAGHGGGLNGCHYAASKGALCSMGKNLATTLAADGVTVNIVSPAMIQATGMIPTPIAQSWPRGADLEKIRETDPGLAIAASVPVHRLGVPEEVANVVVMFAKTGYMTGQDILLAGGLK